MQDDIVKLEKAYETELRHPPGYSLTDTGRLYSFGWMYDGSLVKIELCSGSVAVLRETNNTIIVEVFAEKGQRCWEDMIGKIQWMMGLNEDIDDYRKRARDDPLVGGVVETLPGLRLRSCSIWYAVLVAVCQQNASFRQGWGMLYKLHLLASRRLRTPYGLYLETPRPDKLSYHVLREARLGYRARTVMELARRRVEELDCSSVDVIREVHGIGAYSHALTKLLACRDYSSLPLDRWLKRLAAEAYRVPEPSASSELARRFGKWKGLAALHTTVGFDAEPLRRALERLRRGENKPGKTEPSPLSLWRYTPPEP
ncbi:hypothetical protein Pyrde_1979 [Pyrodictium delaneyi]|uniref:HhH-GPD domain-containing protein n=1 Tax=Pyrodictium delaneyi TaxID=1273541 RepID=A0A0P0N5X6_9CREN|nr:hypothetical protein [Pyrodictium delaneyi]ALL02022.1 hypothetical protein Pyrde_1979 [Pyrodictium delaneyi]